MNIFCSQNSNIDWSIHPYNETGDQRLVKNTPSCESYFIGYTLVSTGWATATPGVHQILCRVENERWQDLAARTDAYESCTIFLSSAAVCFERMAATGIDYDPLP
jgi:hypothetical protein